MTKFLLFLFSILLLSCQQKKETQNLLIESIANENSNEIFTPHSGTFIFGKSNEEGKLVYMDVSTLQKIYLWDSLYHKMNYREFVLGAINQEIIFDCNYINWCFNINNEIISFCKTNSFSEFLKTYTGEFANTGGLYVNNRFSFDEKMTIIYCLFQHNYYTGYDDYLGFYLIEKMELPPDGRRVLKR